MEEQIFNILYLNATSMMSGAEFSLLSLLEKVDKEKFNPTLLLPEEGPFFQKAKQAGIEGILLPSMIKFGEGYRVHKLPKFITSLYKVMKVIKQKRINIVHSNSPRVAFLGGMAAKLSSIPSVIHVRDIHQSPFSQPLKSRLLDFLSDMIVSVSQATKDSIAEATPSIESKIKVVYNGIDFERLDNRPIRDIRPEFGIRENTPIIGSVGLIHPVKGLEILIRSASVIKNQFPSIKVFIIGGALLEMDIKYINGLDNLVKELDLEDNVIFTGFREDVFDLIKAMDVLVHPAIYPEPFPRSLLEAAAMKKPIVATKVGGVPEILDHDVSGLLIEPSDPTSLAKAVLSLLNNKEKAENLALKARQKVEKSFSIEKHVDHIETIYVKLLGISS